MNGGRTGVKMLPKGLACLIFSFLISQMGRLSLLSETAGGFPRAVPTLHTLGSLDFHASPPNQFE